MALVRQNAETLLNDLAKHLVALKASEGRLNDEARRSYLQVSHYYRDRCCFPCMLSNLKPPSGLRIYTINMHRPTIPMWSK
jgi:hypothetical protein